MTDVYYSEKKHEMGKSRLALAKLSQAQGLTLRLARLAQTTSYEDGHARSDYHLPVHSAVCPLGITLSGKHPSSPGNVSSKMLVGQVKFPARLPKGQASRKINVEP